MRIVLCLVLLALTSQPSRASPEEDCLGGGPIATVQGCTQALETTSDRSKRYRFLGRRIMGSAELLLLGAKPLRSQPEVERDIAEMFQMFPQNAHGYEVRGRWNSALRRNPDAEADFNKAVELAPSLPSPYSFRGRFYLDLGRIVPAKADFEQALKIKPNYPSGLAGLAQITAANGDLAGALKLLDQALAGSPSWAPGYTYRGEVQLQKKDYAKAIADFDKAIELARGSIRAERGKQDALAGLAPSSAPPAATTPTVPSSGPPAAPTPPPQQDPQNTPYQKAEALRKAGKCAEAIVAYDEALKLNPKAFGAMFNKAACLEMTRRTDDAIALYNSVTVSEAPQSLRSASAVSVGRIFLNVNKPRAAVKPLTTAVSLNPNDVDGHFFRMLAFYYLGEYNDARTDAQKLQTLTEQKKDNAIGWEALILASMGDDTAATERALAALQINPRSPPALTAQAKLSLKRGDPESADRTLRDVPGNFGEARLIQQMVMLHRILKSTDKPLVSR